MRNWGCTQARKPRGRESLGSLKFQGGQCQRMIADRCPGKSPGFSNLKLSSYAPQDKTHPPVFSFHHVRSILHTCVRDLHRNDIRIRLEPYRNHQVIDVCFYIGGIVYGAIITYLWLRDQPRHNKRKGPGIRMQPRDYFFLLVGLIIGAGLALVGSFIYHVAKFLIKLYN